MKLSKWVPSPYAEFGIYRSCGSGNENVSYLPHDIVWRHDQGSYCFVGKSSSSKVTIVTILMLIDPAEVEICCFTTWQHVITWSKRHTTWRVEAPHPKLPTYQWKYRYNVFILSHDIRWSFDQRAKWLCQREPLNLSHHCVKFDVYRSCRNGDITFLSSPEMTWSHDQRDM